MGAARRVLCALVVVAAADDVQDIYETSSVGRVPVGFADEVEIEANGRASKLVFDGARSDLKQEALQFVERLGIDRGVGCDGSDCAADALSKTMAAAVRRRRERSAAPASLSPGVLETATSGRRRRDAHRRRQRYGEAFDRAGLRVARTRRGHRLAVSAKDLLVSPSLDFFGTFEEPALALMLTLVKFGDDVADVGANVGAHLVRKPASTSTSR